jgi:hypothetical protein
MKLCDHSKLQIWRNLILGLTLGLSLAGCVETVATDKTASDATSVPAPTTASVALLLTDAPTDEFTHINLTIDRVELMAVDGSKVPLFEGLRTIDLLSLRNTADLFAANNAVPPGLYEKIRMHLTDVELVKVDDDGEVERIHPRLLANGKLDLNPRKSFVLAPGKSLVIQVDMDAKKSIHIVGHDRDKQDNKKDNEHSGDNENASAKSNKKDDKKSNDAQAADHDNGANKEDKSHHESDNYHFRPVVFIDIIDMASTVKTVGKVVRIEGDVTKIDIAKQQVEVCNIQDIATNCVTMQVSAKTNLYFNNPAAPTGTGLGMLTLSEITKLERGVGFGRVRMMNGTTWLDVDAMEFGPVDAFMRVIGDVVGAPDASTNIFYFGIHRAQHYIEGSVFRIVPVATAKLYSRDGIELDWSAMLVGQVVEVEGVLVRTAVNYTIETGVVYLDINAAGSGAMMNGALTHMNTTGFSVSTNAGDYCVVPEATVNVFSVITSPDGTLSGSRESLSILQEGQVLDLYGTIGADGCYHATDVLVYLQ